MATLMIRDLDDTVKARLRIRAAENGRSMEAEARSLLAAALTGVRPNRGLGSYIHEQFADLGDTGLTLAPRTEPARASDLDV